MRRAGCENPSYERADTSASIRSSLQVKVWLPACQGQHVGTNSFAGIVHLCGKTARNKFLDEVVEQNENDVFSIQQRATAALKLSFLTAAA